MLKKKEVEVNIVVFFFKYKKHQWYKWAEGRYLYKL